MKIRLPIPDNWQDFEFICHQLWKDIWGDVNAQRHGRAGQKQYGVDVYGTPLYSSKLAAVQCKDKDALLGSPLKSKELLTEATKAKKFHPAINSFSLATTAARDQSIQEVVRVLNNKKTYPFEINVWSWNDIAEEIMARPLILNNYWKDFSLESDSVNAVVNINSTNDKFHAFFSRDFFVKSVASGTREELRRVFYELTDNALLHGRARQVELFFEGNKFVIQDDGVLFNPLRQLDPTKASIHSHAGSKEFFDFVNKSQGHANFSYEVIIEDGVNKNKLIIELDDFYCKGNKSEFCEILISKEDAFGRDAARNFIYSKNISRETTKLSLVLPDGLCKSSKFEMIKTVHSIVQVDCDVTISCANEDERREIEKVTQDAGVNFLIKSRV